MRGSMNGAWQAMWPLCLDSRRRQSLVRVQGADRYTAYKSTARCIAVQALLITDEQADSDTLAVGGRVAQHSVMRDQ